MGQKKVPGQWERQTGTGRRNARLRMTGMMFLFALLIFVISDLFAKEQTFSENENRMLSGKPEMTLQRVADGSYMRQFESYKSDQFPGRDFWVGMKTGIDWLAGNREENGVFKCSDGYLMEEAGLPDAKALQENIQAMKKFQKNHENIQMNVLVVPDAVSVLEEKLPPFASTASQRELLEEVRKSLSDSFVWMDAFTPLHQHKEDEVYYKTDHHWTTKGAYYVFKSTASVLGIEKNRMVKMEPYAVTDSFNGTLSSRSGYERSRKEPIYIYLPEEDTAKVVVNYTEEQRKTVSMYDSSKLDGKDKYAVFFGGNHPLIKIRTMSGSQDRLLVVKDSYANCFLPFLTFYYRDIVVVDPRYYYGNLETLMKENEITQVLFLYNANNFFKDNNISGVLESDKTE